MKNVNLYNQDGSLSPEARLLISHRPDNVSRKEWIKRLKDFKSALSAEDLKEFERLKNKENCIRWRANNPEKVRQDSVDWRVANPEKSKEMSDRWRAANLDHASNYTNNYYKRRKSEDPLFRFLCNMRSNCRRVVKQLSLGKKPVSTFKWIGCSPEELKAHLESLFIEGMTWENYGEWHVDHIRPVCSFTAEEWEQVNHYSNLRPLWAEDNIAKSVFDKRQSVKKETPILKESPSVVMNLH